MPWLEPHWFQTYNNILKLRQSETNVENAINEDGQKFHKRRVSFHNVKTVQNFEKDNLNLLDGSPFKEKIHETMSSDGILSPGKSQVALSAPILTIDNEENASFMNDTMMVSDGSTLS
ncbi:hypothetical protein DICVIV_03435 [Dictyocaulus viviparus]|uniref:Uncharacterized protein n=1 Tax=Dictyocaulus viviparus TaxID=29172 RepID=A0A0D8Y329_DICVI|nr:hypothetical protein DICVIV_03435 [Dictyocaulus viviparus]